MTVQEWLGKDNTLGIDIWEKKYRYNNETFDEFLDRVSSHDEEVKQLIIDKKFLFGGRILANRNTDIKGITYSNCYVIPEVEDNIESIYNTCGMLARTFSYGGGCGVDISKLRPAGAQVNNSARTTTGAVSFMQTLSMVAETIGQRGRRGATMLSMDVNHPDIEQFVDIKTDLTKVTGANISVRVNDKFMKAVENNSDYILHWPCNDECLYHIKEDPLQAPYNKLIPIKNGDVIIGYYKRINAKNLFNKLIKNNWDYAEPGILYWDRITKWNLLSEDPEFSYKGVNPCAEEPLPAGGSCLLGSINLSAFVGNDRTFNFPDFIKTVHIAVRALNKVLIDGLPLHPLKIQQESVRDWRQIGLGVMGIADMLIKMGIKYDSEKGITVCKAIANLLASHAIDESAEMANSLEGAYPKFNLEAVLKSEYLKAHVFPETLEKIKRTGLYNSQVLTIAPTGSLSTMLQISGGIEPVFANYYTRTTKSLHNEDKTYKVYTKIAQDWLNAHPGEELPDYFIESSNISPEFRVKMQAVWQDAIDASISSTVNLPESATVEDVYNIYMNAWKNGLKGITIFRSGCKRIAILNAEPEKKEDSKISLKRGDIVKAGNNCIGLKRTLMTGCGSLHCEAFFDPKTGDLREIYLSKGSTGGCNNFMIGLSRMISIAARGGVGIEAILDQLKSCGTCPSYAVRTATKKDTSKGSCCPVAVGNAIREMHKEILQRLDNCNMSLDDGTVELVKASVSINKDYNNKCPECGEELIHETGCCSCPSCGYSKCG